MVQVVSKLSLRRSGFVTGPICVRYVGGQSDVGTYFPASPSQPVFFHQFSSVIFILVLLLLERHQPEPENFKTKQCSFGYRGGGGAGQTHTFRFFFESSVSQSMEVSSPHVSSPLCCS